MNDPVAHEHFAFRWGCWSAGRFVCSAENRRKLCIDDRLDEKWAQAFSEHMEVPKVVPDGDYVLSFVRWEEEMDGVNWWSGHMVCLDARWLVWSGMEGLC